MVDLALPDGVLERPHHVLLTDDVGEAPRAMAAVQGGAGRHALSSLVWRSEEDC